MHAGSRNIIISWLEGIWLISGCFGSPCVATSMRGRLGPSCETIREAIRRGLGASGPRRCAVSGSIGGAASIIRIYCP
jgi:hypothetical protein